MLYAQALLFLLAEKNRFLRFKHLQNDVSIAFDPLCLREDNARFLVEVLDGVFETDF